MSLGHSNVQEALMAPFYSGYDANFRLHSDDIAAIQSLYGKLNNILEQNPHYLYQESLNFMNLDCVLL